MTARPAMTLDHYLDALALARTTLRGDEEGALAIISSCDVGMTFQAMTMLFLNLTFAVTGGSAENVDAYLDVMQQKIPGEMFGDEPR